MAFYISGPKLLFETTEMSTHPNSTQQESNYIYLYTTKFRTSIKIRLNRKFESTEFETMRVNCIYNKNQKSPGKSVKFRRKKSSGFVLYIIVILTLKIHCRAALPTSGHGSCDGGVEG